MILAFQVFEYLGGASFYGNKFGIGNLVMNDKRKAKHDLLDDFFLIGSVTS